MIRPYIETPATFGRDRSLVGVLCRTAAPDAQRPMVVFLNAGIIHRPGPNRMNTRLARALAHIGVSSLRFDQSGIGDSVLPAAATAMRIRDRVRIDIDDALDFAREQCDASGLVVGGLCSGADNALRTAAERDDVCGVFTLDLNVARTRGYWARHYARRMMRGESWRNILTGRHAAPPRLRALNDGTVETAPEEQALPHDAVIPQSEMREMLHRVVGREVALLCIFSGGIEKHYNYARQFLDLFPEVNFADRLRVQYEPDADHTFSGAALQERLRLSVVGWVRETAFRGVAARGGRVVEIGPPESDRMRCSAVVSPSERSSPSSAPDTP